MSIDTAKPEALRLADWHKAMADEPKRNQVKREKHAATAAELRRLHAENDHLRTIADTDKASADHWRAECEKMRQGGEAVAWAEGYRAGVEDERTSEANIGIAGFGAKVEPARQNPYHTSPPLQADGQTAKQCYDHLMEGELETGPLERLRFFCSLAMNGQDWLDVEPFFAVLQADACKVPPSFVEWLRREMPAGTEIGDPDWWAPRILRAALSASQAAPTQVETQWQPIETAPKDGTEFVAAYARQGFVKQLVSYNTIHGHWQSKGEWEPGFTQNATHWMPLPPAPSTPPMEPGQQK
jgi:hypothetical protein